MFVLFIITPKKGTPSWRCWYAPASKKWQEVFGWISARAGSGVFGVERCRERIIPGSLRGFVQKLTVRSGLLAAMSPSEADEPREGQGYFTMFTSGARPWMRTSRRSPDSTRPTPLGGGGKHHVAGEQGAGGGWLIPDGGAGCRTANEPCLTGLLPKHGAPSIARPVLEPKAPDAERCSALLSRNCHHTGSVWNERHPTPDPLTHFAYCPPAQRSPYSADLP